MESFLKRLFSHSHSSRILPCLCLVFIALVPPEIHARIGETYKQCVYRYGNSTTNIQGFGCILGVAGFEKSGISVAVAFDRPNRQGFIVLYTPVNAGNILANQQLKEAQIDSLMSSLNVSWIALDDALGAIAKSPPSKQGKSSSLVVKKTNTNAMPKWKENMRSAEKAAQDFLNALVKGRSLLASRSGLAFDNDSPALFRSLPIIPIVEPYRRSGDHLFAFKISGTTGLLLINSDVSKSISDWANAYVESLKPPEDKGQPLKGF